MATNGLNLESSFVDGESKDYSHSTYESMAENQKKDFYTNNNDDLVESFDGAKIDRSEYGNDDNALFDSKENDVIRVIDEGISSIEGLPYARSEPGKKKYGYSHDYSSVPGDMSFGTEHVAQVLGVSSQAVRNYADMFEDYLQIRRKAKGQRIFTHESIEKLRQLLKVKDEHNFTMEQMKEYLKDPDKLSLVPEEKKLEAIMEVVQKNMMENMRSILSELVNQNSLLIEKKEAEQQQVIIELQDQIKKQDEVMGEVLSLLKKQDEDTSTASAQQIDKLIALIEEKNDKIEELVLSSKEKDALIAELEKKAKKKFLGIF